MALDDFFIVTTSPRIFVVQSLRRPKHFALLIAAAIVTILLPLQSALAQQTIDASAVASTASQSHSLISDTALSNTTGRVAANVTAGDGNAQSNAAAIGFSTNGASSSANLSNQQQSTILPAGVRGSEDAAIQSEAFRSVRGLVSVNQSSGSANTQANLAVLGVGRVAEVGVDQLLQVSAPAPGDSTAAPTQPAHAQKSTIADTAFVGSSGVVQVSQAAGMGNRTANIFALGVSTASP